MRFGLLWAGLTVVSRPVLAQDDLAACEAHMLDKAVVNSLCSVRPTAEALDDPGDGEEACLLGANVGITIGCLHATTYTHNRLQWRTDHPSLERAQVAACAHANGDVFMCAHGFYATVRSVFRRLAEDDLLSQTEYALAVPPTGRQATQKLIRLSLRLATAATRYLYLSVQSSHGEASQAIAHWCATLPPIAREDCSTGLARQFRGWSAAGPDHWEAAPNLLAHIPLGFTNSSLAVAVYANEPIETAATAFCGELALPPDDCIRLARAAIRREMQTWHRFF
ncbi:hypothetical protein ACHHYP_20135 [Achlya hypogyna]|uniref:Secreted protein n=1 Tax=Achlya hypogyna TaxID=1202772 RepID=A0A1V9Z3C5_ACHHY|nr:hypothetical protein ACHHYP_20135 [Achlya hypogyna]